MSELAKLGPDAVHVAVDVQRMFLEPTRWRVASMPAILPGIAALVKARPGRTLFTRFVVPRHADDARGRWRRYYEHWPDFTGERLPAEMLDIVPDLAGLATAGTTFDKTSYSALEAPAFTARLEALRADALIFSGVETDVCVLATLLTAVDRGFRVIAVADAMASSSAEAHAAVLGSILPRLDQQVEIASTEAVLAAWSEC